MKPAKTEQLKARWETEDGKRRLKEVEKAAQKKKNNWEEILIGFPFVDEIPNGRDLRFANLAGAHIVHADFAETFFEHANLREALLDNTDFRKSKFTGADLTKAVMTGADLRNADFGDGDIRISRIFGIQADGANLTDADFSRTDLRGTNLNNVNTTNRVSISSTNFSEARFDRATSFLGVETNRVAWAGNPLLKRHIEDQQWLHAWKNQSKWHKELLFPIWSWSCDCGRSLFRWAFWSFLLAMYFAGIYWMCGFCFETSPGHTLADANWFAPIYYSIVTFTTLGFGDITPKPTEALMQFYVTAEVLLGYIMLGGLISIFANKLARRA